MQISLDRKKFIPDPTHPTIFPWEDVMDCFDQSLKNEDFEHHQKCPKCNRPAEYLAWIEFCSPKWTWENLCGRKGPLSICPDCKIQVSFWSTIIS